MALVGLSRCLFETKAPDQLVGTSISTGNPGSVKASFKLDSQPISFSGWVMIFASTQIPVPHFQPEPLKRWVILDAEELVLGPEMLSGIADTSWPETSKLGDSIFSFNIVLEGDTIGAMIRNLHYFKIEKRIGLGDDTISAHPLRMAIAFSRLERLSAFISPGTLSQSRNNFLFIYGTGYSAIGNDGYFDFPLMPKGFYNLSHIALPRMDIGTGSGKDSANIYSVDSVIETGSRVSAEIGKPAGRIKLPDFYIQNQIP